MKSIKITKSEARQFLICYQGLDGSTKLTGKDGVLEYIKKVGCIQYDPLNVVGRNADLVLQSRIQDYNPTILEKMLYDDRSLIDGWDKMMAIYRTEDWPFFNRIRQQRATEIKGVLRRRDSQDALNFTNKVRELLIQQGPLFPSQISLGECGKRRWGHRNLSSAAMDYMFNTGELGIHSKENTQKRYDIIENLLPKELLECQEIFSSDNDFYKWYFKRRVGSVGLLWDRNGGGWLGFFLSDKNLRSSILSELVEENSLLALSIEGIDETFFIKQEDSQLLNSIKQREKEVRFLAPLDNLLWDRDMIEKIFDYKYSWEVYIPVDKRKYGYYVLPVLYGDRLIARFEPEQQRGNSPLIIKKWWWEEGIVVTEAIINYVEKALKDFCEYLQADGIHNSWLNVVKGH